MYRPRGKKRTNENRSPARRRKNAGLRRRTTFKIKLRRG